MRCWLSVTVQCVQIIQRARHISRCRLEGRQIERYDVDNEAAEASERALADLVDQFLEYDFLSGTAHAFFSSVDHLMNPAMHSKGG